MKQMCLVIMSIDRSHSFLTLDTGERVTAVQ